jgi:Ca2+-binding RTX toxin-like protein
VVDGGDGIDTAGYGDAQAAVAVDLRKAGAQITGAGTDTLVNIENVDGSAFGDTIRGNDEANVLAGVDGADKLYGYGGDDTVDGGNGDDYLYGLDGNDTLTGGSGYDRMYGGVGDDIYYVTDATDFTYELIGEGADRVVATIDHQLRDHVENLTLTGSAVIGKGNVLGNQISGNAGLNKLYGYDGNDVIDGGAGDDHVSGGNGNDTLTGGAGYDKLYGGLGDDTFIVTDATDFAYENAGEGRDKVIASVDHRLRDHIEELELTGTADIRGYGNAENNLITGNGGANLLYGRDGHDTLRGEAGNDLLYGENGNDRLDGGAGQDRYYGGAGADQFIFDDGDFAGPTPDRIMDFSQLEGDLIDLGAVDANSALAGDQGFSFVGSNAFTGTAGQLRTFQAGGMTYVEGDTNGDGTADFLIRIDGLHDLQGSDFII